MTPAAIRGNRFAVRYAADSHQHAFEHLRRRRLLALESHAQSFGQRLDLRYLRAEQDLLIATAYPALERPHQVRITAGNELRSQLHDTDPAAERVIDTSHLEPNDAAADDQQAAGKLRQLNASVESMIRGSAGIPGKRMASEPTAMMH